MKKILFSLAMVGVASAVAIGATGAFFSDTETSTGNTFTAGAIDLQIDSTATYNGVVVPGSTWVLKDLVPTADKFFDLLDVKPGDAGSDEVSLHVTNNDAWLCATVSNLVSQDNSCTEPESDPTSGNDLTCGDPGVGEGELQGAMTWTVWRDDGAGGGVMGNNIQDGTEATLYSGNPADVTLAMYDSTTATGPLAAGATGYLGVSWSLPGASGNETQTDSLVGDISFSAVQSRNNLEYVCVD